MSRQGGTTEIGERSLSPTMASSASATSSALRAIGPECGPDPKAEGRVTWYQPGGRPQSDDAAERRGYPKRPTEIRALGERDHAACDCGTPPPVEPPTVKARFHGLRERRRPCSRYWRRLRIGRVGLGEDDRACLS